MIEVFYLTTKLIEQPCTMEISEELGLLDPIIKFHFTIIYFDKSSKFWRNCIRLIRNGQSKDRMGELDEIPQPSWS